ncbi:hypothetical protein [Pseudonocardia hydrocarbonoxydans]|uniref:hypothetical protein n=1 Tax=Pseudonocardia hydrocarbonoxydans TaxID=76726 RepID=UPI00114268BA|nr:hypothetical protein [Pseudonocardia hydrocarbonoxydans]
MPTCPTCSTTKPREAFAVDRSKASGHKSACKLCDAASSRAYDAAHLDARRARQRAAGRRRRA